MAHLSVVKPDKDRRHLRWELFPEEFEKLIKSTHSAPVIRGLSGPDRAMLYLTAAYTGLCASELAALTPACFTFDSDPPCVTVDTRTANNREQDVLPLRYDVSAMLRGWLKGKPFDDRLWPGKWAEHFEILLKRDLQQACVPYVDASGRYADFHSLRHRFISGLARAGAHPKVAQDLACHKTLDMTMKVYTHTHTGDLVDALENLPAPISTTTESKSQEVIATGTNGSEEFAPMFARDDDFSGLSVTTDGDTLIGADASAEEHNQPPGKPYTWLR